MKGRSLLYLVPSVLVEAFLGVAALAFLRLDSIVNETLYEFSLTFSSSWAVPYWLSIRLGLGLVGFAMVLTAVSGYLHFSNMRRQIADAMVYVCDSCGRSWRVLDEIKKVNGELPKLRVLTSCAFCNRKLLDQT